MAFANVQAALQKGGLAPYVAAGKSELIGKHTQTGSIRNLTGLIQIDPTTFIFEGEVGPNPDEPGNPEIHIIKTHHGRIFCKWTAVFTLKIVDANGDAVFSGDGEFTVVGGTGKYKDASGRFTTLFETKPVAPGSTRQSPNTTNWATSAATDPDRTRGMSTSSLGLPLRRPDRAVGETSLRLPFIPGAVPAISGSRLGPNSPGW